MSEKLKLVTQRSSNDLARGTRVAKVYVASKASVKRYPDKWKELRANGWHINSTWIDEAGEGQTADWSELWTRIVREITEAVGLIIWVEPDGAKLKGALVEVGVALGQGKRVALVHGIQNENWRFDEEAPRHGHPIGTWWHHPLVRTFSSLEYGYAYAMGDMHVWSPCGMCETPEYCTNKLRGCDKMEALDAGIEPL